MCYDAEKLPKTEEDWRLKNFVHKTHFGYYSWPAEMKVDNFCVKLFEIDILLLIDEKHKENRIYHTYDLNILLKKFVEL